jgi:peptidoglycan/LPS O-acetylase OafA/YrhL
MSAELSSGMLPTFPREQSRRLRSLDALRGLAALAVLLVHIPHLQNSSFRGNQLLFFPLEFGMRGVILFLVISGFCIHLSVAKEIARGQGVRCNWTAFWRRRFHRLYPPYVAAIAFSLLLLLALYRSLPYATWYLDCKKLIFWDLVTHLLMIHNLFNRYILGLANGPFWTLGLEEQLYILYAVFLFCRYRMSLAKAFWVTLATTVLWVGVGLVITYLRNCPGAGPPYGWPFWPFTVWFVWILGAVAAEAYAGVICLPRWCYQRRAACLAIGLGVFLYPPIFHFLHADRLQASMLGHNAAILSIVTNGWLTTRLGDYAFALGFFVLLNRWVRAEMQGRSQGRAIRWLAQLGIFSYSLYLTHAPILMTSEWWLGTTVGLGNTILTTLLRYALYVPLCLAVAYGFFRLVERRFLNSRLSEPMQAPAEALLGKAA